MGNMNRRNQRDRSLLQLAQGTRWMAAGAVALAGAMSAAVAVAKPGHSKAAKPAVTITPKSTVAPATVPPSTATDPESDEPTQTSPPTAAPTTVSPPTAPPQTASTAPVVTSGGS
jgi:hypothetical protein